LKGLKYLHGCGVNHGDLKSHNVLLNAEGAKISDCGLSHVCSAIGLKTGNGAFIADKVGTLWKSETLRRRGNRLRKSRTVSWASSEREKTLGRQPGEVSLGLADVPRLSPLG